MATAKDGETHCKVKLREETSKTELKRQLERATGVPAADQRLRMGGYNQLVMIDAASNIRVGSCGTSAAIRAVDSAHMLESFK